jgi:excisionase family DNA binding protein
MAERASLLSTPVQLLTVIETAKRLRCSPNHVYRLIAAGKLPSLDVALPESQRAKTRVNEEDLAAYIKGSTTTP